MYLLSFYIILCFLQITVMKSNVLIVYILSLLDVKWVNLLTKWYLVVNCGNIFYIFAVYQ